MLRSSLSPLSPPKNHLLPEEALGGLIVILQRLVLSQPLSNFHDCHLSLVIKEAQLSSHGLLHLQLGNLRVTLYLIRVVLR